MNDNIIYIKIRRGLSFPTPRVALQRDVTLFTVSADNDDFLDRQAGVKVYKPMYYPFTITIPLYCYSAFICHS